MTPIATVSRANPVANRFDNPRIGNRVTAAAGVGGVYHAMEKAIPNRALVPLLKMNQHGGIDCPGCAWPEPAQGDINFVEFCENGAKAIAQETTPKRVTREFFANTTVQQMREMTDYELDQLGRLTEPMLYDRSRGDEKYHPVSWDEAYDLIAEQLKATDPDRAIFYTSGTAVNESAFIFGVLGRRHGSNNLPDCANLCHDSTGVALAKTVGVGKGSIVMQDMYNTDLIISVGQNPGTNHPRSLTAFKKQKENGGKFITINPMPETGLMKFKEPQSVKGAIGIADKISDEYVQVRLDGDRALFQQINREVIRRDLLDRKFLDEFCSNVDETIAHLNSLDDATLERGSGVSQREVKKIVDYVEKAETVVLAWTLGVTQHRNAVATIQEMMNFLLLTGNYGKPGAGSAPFRGHSNVQGDRTMGISEKMPEWFLANLEKEFGFDVPRKHGVSSTGAGMQLRDKNVDFFMSLGGNYIRAMSDTTALEDGMTATKLSAHMLTKLNGTCAWPGEKSLILPVRSRTDVDIQASGPQKVSVEASDSKVSASFPKRRANRDLDLHSEVQIICNVGERTFGDAFWKPMMDNYDVIRDHIANVIPGFENYNERLKRPGGFMLPHAARERIFNTSDGKAQLTINETDTIELEGDQLLLTTVRSHDQYNTISYGLDDRYRGVRGGRRVIFIRKEDLIQRGLKDGDIVDVVSEYESGRRVAPNFRLVEYNIAKDCVGGYFPELNILVPVEHMAKGSETPVSKSLVVHLEPTGQNANNL
ncbi:FdhF/YdeP family oxidoreductase [Corynebacterium phoceense]|uniref:FdhF/YdeP family oxidoreductase n=1 Tax=Corynebacterium phoceense TaxID=1686286 RepID=UPI000839B3A2|nr:FdhF/YdeP family oxidoreductase [Corynebacterium phoceense]MBF9010147.1 FdhF/YdeP family oxidoreductase [Corynebacterium phoceense]